MKAIIMAGGAGARLKPYTVTIPKPLVPVGEEPIMKLLIERLKSQGIRKITLCVNHMSELIMAYFGDGHKLGIEIEYSHEEEALGTIAPLKLIRSLPENFIVLNSDLLTDFDFSDFFSFHLKNNAVATIATYKRVSKIDFGVIKIGSNTNVVSFVEKPEYNFDVSMGIYAFNKKVLNYIPDNDYFGFDQLMEVLLKAGQVIKTYEHNGYWLDIGRPEDYELANECFTQIVKNEVQKYGI